jgi:hypothetical protein
MGHKAKPKSKATSPVKSTEKRKTTPQIKPSPTTKNNQKAEAAQKTQTIPPVDGRVSSSSITALCVQVSAERAVKEYRQEPKAQPSQKADTTTPFFVFHKREHKKDGADIIGRRGLGVWKASPGRNKSWANCRRHKLAHNNLEHFRQSKLPSNAFGWRFSMLLTPLTLVRGHGMLVIKQSAPKTKRVSNARHFQDLGSEHSPEWVLPGELPYRRLGVPQETEYRGGVNFLRLAVGRETVGITAEAFLGRISFSTTQTKPLDNKTHTRFSKSEDLVVINLLRNESHADVYLVQDLHDLSKFYHVHAFLNQNHGLTGNWHTFSKRKMDRLRKSNGFHAETVQHGRKIVVMKADSKDDTNLRIKNMQREFPPLPNTGKSPFSMNSHILDADDQCSEGKAAKIRLPRNMQLSYAVVVKPKRSIKRPVNSNHRAYKAWVDRNGKTKKPADTMSASRCPAKILCWVSQRMCGILSLSSTGGSFGTSPRVTASRFCRRLFCRVDLSQFELS